jgi:hypothetical protein
MKNLINLLILMLIVYTVNVSGATTTTNTVTSPSGNLTIDTASSAGNVVVPSRLEVQSTTKGSHPCPSMTDAEMLAIASPQDGDCAHNTTLDSWLVYNSTLVAWEEMGGGAGGISDWATATGYAIGDVVIESLKIYQANTGHTSGVFLTDIANWTQIANNVGDAAGVLPIANGGTNSSTALSGSSIAISNGTAIVQGAAGTSTTLLHGNAAGAPTYSAADLTADVSGVLPIANGGTNSSTALSGSSIAISNGTSIVQGAAGTSTTLLHGNAAGAPTYGAADLTTDVTGVLPMANGGTNKNMTATLGGMFVSDSDSAELLTGTTGQIPQFNTAGAMTAVNKSISGDDDSGASVTVEEIQVPNNQLTATTTNKYRVETGNSDILTNSSFEDTTLTGWDFDDGTEDGVTSASSVTDGAASISFSPSSESVILYQDSTLYAAALAGLNGIISVDAYATSNDLYLCQRKAGALVASTDGTNITNCAQHSGSSTVEPLTLPITFDSTGTSNGVQLVTLTATTAAVKTTSTGTYRADASSLKKGVLAPVSLYGPWTPYTPVFTGFGTVTPTLGDIQYRLAPQGIEIRGKFTTGTGTGTEARISLPTGLTSAGTASIAAIQIAGEYATNLSGANSHGGFLHIEPSVTYLTIGSQGTFGSTAITATAKALGSDFSTGIIISFNDIVVPIASMTNSTAMYSAQCGASCKEYFVASLHSNGGTGSPLVVNRLNVANWLTSSSCTRTNIGLYTCNYAGLGLTVIPKIDCDTESQGYACSVSTPTTTSVDILTESEAAGTDADRQFTISLTKQGADALASSTIIGFFKGMNATGGSTRPIITSFNVGTTGTISKEKGDPVNGNCTNANNTVCTFNSVWASDPTCLCTATNSAKICNIDVVTETTSALTIFRFNDAGSGESPTIRVLCHGEGSQ